MEHESTSTETIDETQVDEPQADEAQVDEPQAGEQVIDQQSEPFVGRWQNLISTTNWEKGKIIFDWREALIASDAPSTEYSDEAWARRVGGVTSPHVGRLRRVFETFHADHETYPSLYWSHFLAALDWDDAPLWLEGAVRSGWSVSVMREERWRATGAAESDRPEATDIVTADKDEDVVMPAQGGGSSRVKDDSDGDVPAGPRPEDPDFGDEGQNLGSGSPPPAAALTEAVPTPADIADLAQPFAGLPELPSDLSEALEMFKLAILRHKAAHWADVSQETVLKAVAGLNVLTTSES